MIKEATAGALALLLVCSSGVAQVREAANFSGVWSTAATADPADPRWALEDFSCYFGCTLAEFEHLLALLDDPANDDRPYADLMREADRQGSEEFLSLATD